MDQASGPSKADEVRISIPDLNSSTLPSSSKDEAAGLVGKDNLLKKNYNVSLTDNLVGMDHHMDEMTQLLDINGDNGVRIVVILGTCGIGKTTIAESMYNQLCDHFQPLCTFVKDVRDKVERNGSCDGLQKQLVHDVIKRPADGIALDIKSAFKNKKVLIVLDDVEDKSQLNKIIGTGDYFGPGSRIIVTTRNEKVFEESKGDLIYKPSKMNDHDSLLLFRNHAFRSLQPSERLEHISKQLAQTAEGVPLILAVIGKMLCKKKKEIWEETLKKIGERLFNMKKEIWEETLKKINNAILRKKWLTIAKGLEALFPVFVVAIMPFTKNKLPFKIIATVFIFLSIALRIVLVRTSEAWKRSGFGGCPRLVLALYTIQICSQVVAIFIDRMWVSMVAPVISFGLVFTKSLDEYVLGRNHDD